jgi:hypothetical protein
VEDHLLVRSDVQAIVGGVWPRGRAEMKLIQGDREGLGVQTLGAVVMRL